MGNIRTIYQNVNKLKADEQTKEAIVGIINDKVDDGFDRMIREISGRFNALDERFNVLDNKIDKVHTELSGKIEILDNKIDKVHTELDSKIDSVRTELKSDINKVNVELDSKINKVHTELKSDINRVYIEFQSDIKVIRSKVEAANVISIVGFSLIVAIVGVIATVLINDLAKSKLQQSPTTISQRLLHPFSS